MSNILQKLSTQDVIDISLLTVVELERLHFDEEVFMANKIKNTPPFSQERNNLMQRGYEFTHAIQREKGLRKNTVLYSFGAKDLYCKLIKSLVKKIKKQNRKDKIIFYEAGIGSGMIVNSLLEEDGICIKGCDVYIEQKLKENSNFDLYEGTIYDALHNVDDSSIDIFYWNDVLEHILDDEIEEYVNLIYRKIAKNGIIITLTPNRLVGPSDITKYFCPPGTKAKGFHFHEYSYHEVKKLFLAYGFKNYSSILMHLKTHRHIALIMHGVGGW